MGKNLGKKRIGNFNPSLSGAIDKIKKAAADFINIVEEEIQADLTQDPDAGEILRLKSLALTNIETASMYAVKAYIHYKKDDN